MELSVVIVTWNSAGHLPACLAALDGELPPSSEIVVVDNASTDGSVVAARSGGARVLINAGNEGFGRACNRGAAESTGNVLLFLNPDTVVRPGAVKTARRALVAAPRTGAVGIRLVGDTGRPQPAADEFLNPARLPARIARRLVRGAATAPVVSGTVDWVYGAFLLLRRDAFDAVGGFDPDYHMYYEDMDLCWRLREAGWSVRYEPSAEAVHVGGASAAHRWEGFPGEEKARSLLTFQRKHATPAQLAAFRVGAAAAYGVFAAALAVRDMVRHNGRGATAGPYWEMARMFARRG